MKPAAKSVAPGLIYVGLMYKAAGVEGCAHYTWESDKVQLCSQISKLNHLTELKFMTANGNVFNLLHVHTSNNSFFILI